MAKIASDFILHAPPGEFPEVFNDVRILLNDDNLLKSVSGTFAQHNRDQFLPVKLDGEQESCLITEHADLGEGRYLDPRSKKTFKFDHLKKEAFDIEHGSVDRVSEPYRSAVEAALTNYHHTFFKYGVSSTYGSSSGGNITIISCVESHHFQPKNYWNGRWRSQWSVTFPESGGKAEVTGILKVQVHYYEDGNVQLVSSKEVKKSININSEQQMAKDFVKVIEDAEQVYQLAISEDYNTMRDTTFKALRRQLPVTRSKIDWNKIVSYQIGSALKQ